MTAAATTPTTPSAPPMANAPEPVPGDPDPARPPASSPNPAPLARSPGRHRRDGTVTNTILGVLGAAFVAVLAFALTSTNARITRLESKVDAGFERVDNKIDELDDKIDTKFGELDDKIDNIDLKLTALIAGLNQTAEVDAALEGSLLNRGTG